MIPTNPGPNKFALIALALTLILHSFLYFSSNKLFHLNEALPKKPFHVTLEPAPPPPENPQAPIFAETNPNAPETASPEPTPFTSTRSTLAAQETPPTDPSENSPLPQLSGELETSLRVTKPEIEIITEPQPSQDPNPSNELIKETSSSSTPLNIAEGSTSNLIIEKNNESSTPKPKPRPKISQSITGPILKNSSSTNRLGITSISTRFSHYGQYLAQMFELISYQWKSLLQNYNYTSSNSLNAYVILSFQILPSGNIQNLTTIHSTTGHIREMLAKDAVQSLTPFQPWNQEMLLTLGDSQSISICFYY